MPGTLFYQLWISQCECLPDKNGAKAYFWNQHDTDSMCFSPPFLLPSSSSPLLSSDIDECADGFVECDSKSTCVNLPGWYHCECRDGYHDNGLFSANGESCVGEWPTFIFLTQICKIWWGQKRLLYLEGTHMKHQFICNNSDQWCVDHIMKQPLHECFIVMKNISFFFKKNVFPNVQMFKCCCFFVLCDVRSSF